MSDIQEGEETGKIEYFEALGMVAALAMASNFHRNWFLSDIDRNVVPALRAGQCKIYLDDHRQPTALVTWALVDEESHEQLRLFGRTPALEKWSSGQHLWFVDAIAPFGSPFHIIRDLQRNHFAHVRRAHAVRRNPDGSIRRLQTWRNRT